MYISLFIYRKLEVASFITLAYYTVYRRPCTVYSTTTHTDVRIQPNLQAYYLAKFDSSRRARLVEAQIMFHFLFPACFIS